MIGCAVSWKWAVACLPGELSQQPMWPHSVHRRRCTQCIPVSRHSTHPLPLGATSTMCSRCVQVSVTGSVFQERQVMPLFRGRSCRSDRLIGVVGDRLLIPLAPPMSTYALPPPLIWPGAARFTFERVRCGELAMNKARFIRGFAAVAALTLVT